MVCERNCTVIKWIEMGTKMKRRKKCKGVKTTVVQKSIQFDDYKRCLFDEKEEMQKMNVIRSYKH